MTHLAVQIYQHGEIDSNLSVVAMLE